jgi:hypothetical protein
MNVEKAVAIFFIALYNIGLLWIIAFVLRSLFDNKD